LIVSYFFFFVLLARADATIHVLPVSEDTNTVFQGTDAVSPALLSNNSDDVYKTHTPCSLQTCYHKVH
jgi:hypothetical protein